jgi:cysteine-rich repeat protein
VVPAHTRLLLAALACAGCLDDAAVVCGDLLCPVASVCLAGACADRDLVEPCLGQVEGRAVYHWPASAPASAWAGCAGPSAAATAFATAARRVTTATPRPATAAAPDCASDERCGNQVIDFAGGETCDDGNALSHDGCHSGCEQELTSWEDLTANAPSGTGSRRGLRRPQRHRRPVHGGC